MDNEEDIFNKAISEIGGKKIISEEEKLEIDKKQIFIDSIMGIDTQNITNGQIPLLSLEEQKHIRENRFKKKKRVRVKPTPYAIDYETLENIVLTWDSTGCNLNFKYFFILCYLTAGRTSEVLKLRKSDFKTRLYHGQEFMSVDMLTLKTDDESRIDRTVLIPKNSFEKKMVDILENEYLCHLHGSEKLFHNQRQYMWKQAQKIDLGIVKVRYLNREKDEWDREYVPHYKLYPHLLRICRLTHLSVRYGYSAQDLMAFTGWSSTQMTSVYIRMQPKDQALKMLNPVEQPYH